MAWMDLTSCMGALYEHKSVWGGSQTANLRPEEPLSCGDVLMHETSNALMMMGLFSNELWSLAALFFFSSLPQQTPADSRLHQNWSCNASPWQFVSINHSYFLHEGYLKIYIYIWYTYTIWIFSVSLKAQHPGKTCRMLEVLDCTICRNTSELISTVRGGFLLVVGEGHVVLPAFFAVDPVGKRLRRVWFLQIWAEYF